jgi:hypothetical protein
MSRARMAMKLAGRGFVGMAQELAEGLTDAQVEQCTTYDRLGGPWRRVYAAIRTLGGIRSELGLRVDKDSELLVSLDQTRDDLGAYCTNYVHPDTDSACRSIPETPAGMVSASLYEIPEVDAQPSDANVVQLQARGSLEDTDRLGRMACKLKAEGHPDLADELLTV